jgi:nitrite reductase (cytochrome c-552)
MVENSEGAHNYKAAHANLDKAEAQLEEGFALLGIA